MRFSEEELDEIASKLRGFPAKQGAKTHSKSGAVMRLSAEINALKKRGYTLEQIAEALSDSGLPIATPTLKNYLHRAGKRARKTSATKAASAQKPARKQMARGSTSFEPAPDTDDI